MIQQKLEFAIKLKAFPAHWPTPYVTPLQQRASSVQLLERRIPDLELNTFRNGIPLVLYSIVFLLLRRWPVIERRQIGVTFLYTVVSFLCASMFFIAVSLLPVATVTTTFSTTFIVFGLFAFSLGWNEQITPRKVLFAALCVSGVTLVIQPWNLHSRPTGTTSLTDHVVTASNHLNDLNGNNVTNKGHMTEVNVNNTNATGFSVTMDNKTSPTLQTSFPNGLAGQIIGYTFSALSGVAFCLDLLLVKRNPYFNEHVLELVFWIIVTNTCFSTVIMLILETPVLPSSWFDVAMLIVHCLSYAAIWPLYIYAPKYVSGNTVTAIVSTEVIFMLIAQYTVLSSILPGHRNWIKVIGVVLVLLGSSLSSLLEIFKKKQL